MKNPNRNRLWPLVGLACLLGGCGSSRPELPPESPDSRAVSTVRLSIAPVRTESGGELVVALFAGEDAWLKDAVARQTVAADRDTVQVAFDGIPAGIYAAAVIHDENGNGELDTRTFPFPKPTEGLAVSNNTWGFGRPDWEPATFELGPEPVELHLELRYF